MRQHSSRALLWVCRTVILFSSVFAFSQSPPPISFQAPRTYGEGTSPTAVAVGDFNRDGKLDLVLATATGISVLPGNGDGTFQAPVSTIAPGGGVSIATGDFNGDGNLDVVVPTANGVTILLGRGDATFVVGPSYAVAATSVTVGDITGDGKLDLIVANNGYLPNGDGYIIILPGNGDGTFQTPVSYDLGAGFLSTAVNTVGAGDFNEDGKLDIVVASGSSGWFTISVIVGNGNGTFQAPAVLGTVEDYPGYALTSLPLAVGDFNGDGRPDVIAGYDYEFNDCSGLGVVVFEGNGDGSFQGGTWFDWNPPVSALAMADLNGDSHMDFAVVPALGSASPSVAVVLANASGGFIAAAQIETGWCFDKDFRSITAADFGGDGISDVAIARAWINHLIVPAAGYDIFTDPNTLEFVTVGDFNGDGKPDLITIGEGVSVFLNNGTAANVSFQPVQAYTGSGAIVVGDFNDDGRSDVAVVTNDTVSILLANPDGTLKPPITVTGSNFCSGAPCAAAVLDLNGDGHSDLVINGTTLLFGNGNGTFLAPVSTGTNGPMAVGDFNGDGHPDLLVGSTLLAGFGDTAHATLTTSGFLAGADFNGDDKLDLVTLGGNYLSVLVGKGDGTFQPPVNYALGPCATSVAVGDFNGDGKPDLAAIYDCWGMPFGGEAVEFLNTVPTQPTATSTLITSSLNPSVLSQKVTFTASVSSATGTASGSILFKDGSNMIGSATLHRGIATFTTLALAPGSHSITASYRGFALPSSSMPLVQKVGKASTVTRLSSSLNPSLIGQAVTFTATVTSGAVGSTPTGTVTFSQVGYTSALGTATLSGGTASFTTSFASAGGYKIYASYKGDANFLSSISSSLSQIVKKFPTTTTLTSNLNPSNYGQNVTFTATVASSYGAPTGTVTFKRGTTTLGMTALNGSTAMFSTSVLNAGTNYLKAVYNGDATFAASTSPQLGQVVKKIASTTTLSSSANPSTLGQPVTFTATVSGAVSTPTGNVTFKKGTTALGTVALVGGVATFSTSTLPTGSNSITARYAGGTNWLASSSAALTQVVH